MGMDVTYECEKCGKVWDATVPYSLNMLVAGYLEFVQTCPNCGHNPSKQVSFSAIRYEGEEASKPQLCGHHHDTREDAVKCAEGMRKEQGGQWATVIQHLEQDGWKAYPWFEPIDGEQN